MEHIELIYKFRKIQIDSKSFWSSPAKIERRITETLRELNQAHVPVYLYGDHLLWACNYLKKKNRSYIEHLNCVGELEEYRYGPSGVERDLAMLKTEYHKNPRNDYPRQWTDRYPWGSSADENF